MGNINIGMINTLCAAALVVLSFLLLHFFFNERKNRKALLKERDRLFISEEQYRIASDAFHLNVARYDINKQIYYNNSPILNSLGFSDIIENVPQAFIEAGIISESCVEDLREFYKQFQNGKSDKESTISLKMQDGSYRWFHAQATLIFDSNQIPNQAIIVFSDVTEQREKEAVYLKWKQSVQQKDPRAYTLFRCNLSKGASFDTMEGELLHFNFDEKIDTFNGRTLEYASHNVYMDDYDEYTSLVNSEYLLAGYYRGNRTHDFEYRECLDDGTLRWIRLNIEMVQYKNSDDIEIFLLYENIDEKKRAEIKLKQQIEKDPLTGILNRFAFRDRLEQVIELSGKDARHALILLDIDNFKILNDNYGHSTGDQELIDIANGLSRVMDSGDFVGRFGGDEFMVFLQNIPNTTYVEKKVAQIQSLIRKSISKEIVISASLGIVIFPDNGNNFNVLYHKVDEALYTAKGSGKDNYFFYNEDTGSVNDIEDSTNKEDNQEKQNLTAKRRMIVIDSDTANLDLIDNAFHNNYFIIFTRDEKTALIRIRLYGKAVSVIFLNIDCNGIDGSYILTELQKNKELKFIPVIIIGNISQREECKKMLKLGASDFVLKPFDDDLLCIRANSAICKAENEILHDVNSLLSMQRDLETKYKAVFENIGTIVIEYNWLSGTFSYDTAISNYIAGTFDERPLWQILLSDMVANSMDVAAMQNMVHRLAEKTRKSNGSMEVMMKTPDKQKHWFSMHAFRRLNEFNITSKIIITFTDINDDVLADEKLRFQAERDDLTGVYNRRTFLKKIEEEVKSNPANTFYLVMGDIDDFKIVNERYGRKKGDELLQYTAEKLSEYAVNRNLCGRLSNDNFAVLVHNSYGVVPVMENAIRSLYDSYPLDIKISCTTGGYLIDNPDMLVDDILDRAALARSSIKEKYGNYLAIYDDKMLDKIKQENDITEHMEEALKKGEFQVYYQPQFNHANGLVVGVEALVRWINPQKGLILPGKFIPIFEKNGFITKLDEFVWNEVAKNLGNWIAQGYEPVPISVNVSREDTNDPHLCDKLLDIVKKNNIPIHLFRLEITESLFIEDSKRMIEVIDKLHSMGFLIEMDDFGSGYSSLNILKDVPVDVLKLDMRFFEGDSNQERGGIILNAVMRMSRWLEMPVIAEGVETKEQADFLLSLSCHVIQGYLYARPMPQKDFEAHIIENNSKVKSHHFNNLDTLSVMDSFWNPQSLDTQLFNNYITAAAVFEYWKGEYEIIRVNKRFIETMRLKGDYVPADGLIRFVEQERDKFDEAVQTAIESGQETKVDVKMASDTDTEIISLHIILRLIAKSADRALFFTTVEEL